MTRELTDPDNDDLLEWSERVTDFDGETLSVSLELDAIDDGSGWTQQDIDSSNIGWLSFTTTKDTLPDGTREAIVDVEADKTQLTVGNSYRFEIVADDGVYTETRTFKLEVKEEGVIKDYALIEKYSGGEEVNGANDDTSIQLDVGSENGVFVVISAATEDQATDLTADPGWISKRDELNHPVNNDLNTHLFTGFVSNDNFTVTINGSQSAVIVAAVKKFRNIDTSNPIIDTTFSNSANKKHNHLLPDLNGFPEQGEIGGFRAVNLVSFKGSSEPTFQDDENLSQNWVWYEDGSGNSAGTIITSRWPAEGYDRVESYDFRHGESTHAIKGTLLLNPADGSFNAPTPKWKDKIFENLSEKTVGYAYSVYKDGSEIESGASGWEVAPWTSAPGVKMTPDSVQMLNSLSKVITATACLMLVEDGTLSLDDKAYNYISNRFTSTGNGVPDIKIQNLLRMRAALGTRENNEIDYNANNIETDFQNYLNVDVLAPPGERLEYQNGQFAFIQFVIDEVTAAGFTDWVQTNIISKSSAEIDYTPPENRSPAEEKIRIYDPSDGSYQDAENPSYEGVGGYYASPREFGKFMTELNMGKFISKSLLRKARDLNFRQMDINGKYGLYNSHGGAHSIGQEGTDAFGTWYPDGTVMFYVTNTDYSNSFVEDQNVARQSFEATSKTDATFFVSEIQNGKVLSFLDDFSKKGSPYWGRDSNIRAIHYNSGDIYIGLRARNEIIKVSSKGRIKKYLPIDSSELNDVYYIEVNDTQGKIYWSSFNNQFLKRANLDGSGIEVLRTQSNSTGELTGFELDPPNGRIFGAEGTDVFKMDLDGSNRTAIVSDPFSGNALSNTYYNSAEEKVYYSSYESGSNGEVRQADPDGTNEASFYTFTGMSFIYGLKIKNGRIYVSGDSVVKSVLLDGTGERKEAEVSDVRFLDSI